MSLSKFGHFATEHSQYEDFDLKGFSESVLKVNNNKGTIDVGNRTISHLKEPDASSDAATKSYVDNVLPYTAGKYWSFSNKRLAAVSPPKDPWDAVTLEYLKENCMIFYPKGGVNGSFNARGVVIDNVASPVNLDQAVNRQFVEQNYATLTNYNDLKRKLDDLTIIVGNLLLLRPRLLKLTPSGQSWDASGLSIINIGPSKRTLT